MTELSKYPTTLKFMWIDFYLVLVIYTHAQDKEGILFCILSYSSLF